MKRFLAILALVGLVIAFPLTALADEDCGNSQGEAEGLYAPPVGQDEGGSAEQDDQGDPDELGGGFRGSGSPPITNGVGGPGIWVIQVIMMSLHLT